MRKTFKIKILLIYRYLIEFISNYSRNIFLKLYNLLNFNKIIIFNRCIVLNNPKILKDLTERNILSSTNGFYKLGIIRFQDQFHQVFYRDNVINNDPDICECIVFTSSPKIIINDSKKTKIDTFAVYDESNPRRFSFSLIKREKIIDGVLSSVYTNLALYDYNNFSGLV